MTIPVGNFVTMNSIVRMHQGYCNANSKAEQDRIMHDCGVRYSALLRLPYLDPVRFHVVDPMHNLLLGTSKQVRLLVP